MDPLLTKRLLGRTLLNCDQHSRRVLLRAAFALTLLSSATTTAFAQDIAKPATEKWRPKEGTYAEPGVNFGLRCGEFGDFIIELNEKSISGNEWSCNLAHNCLIAARTSSGCTLSKKPRSDRMPMREELLERRAGSVFEPCLGLLNVWLIM